MPARGLRSLPCAGGANDRRPRRPARPPGRAPDDFSRLEMHEQSTATSCDESLPFGSVENRPRLMIAPSIWKQRGSNTRKGTAGTQAHPECESPACSPNRPPAEAGRSSLLAHGMQEVVGSSPTSSTGNGLQMNRFGRAVAAPWKRSGVFMEALAPNEALSGLPRTTDSVGLPGLPPAAPPV